MCFWIVHSCSECHNKTPIAWLKPIQCSFEHCLRRNLDLDKWKDIDQRLTSMDWKCTPKCDVKFCGLLIREWDCDMPYYDPSDSSDSEC